MALHNDVGKWGEDLAAERLVAEGCAIIARNWHSGNYELDIIAQQGGQIVFGEVKTRGDNSEANPYESFDRRKMRRMLAAANAYLDAYNVDLEPRFDFFAITGTPKSFNIEHHRDISMPVFR